MTDGKNKANLTEKEKSFVIKHNKMINEGYKKEGKITIDSYVSLTGKKWFVCVVDFLDWEDGYVEDSIKKCLEELIKDVSKK